MRGAFLLAALLLSMAAAAAEPPAAARVQPTQSGELTQLLGRVWAKLRAYLPRDKVSAAQARRTQIAGVRGAEATESVLQPYWKADRTADPVYREQVRQLVAALALADSGALAQALSALESFSSTYPQSEFGPTAQFAAALVYGQLGERSKAATALAHFMQSYPAHPLREDANALLLALRAGQ